MINRARARCEHERGTRTTLLIVAIHKIAVLGAGNGGCAAAADLSLRGCEVRLYSRSESTLQSIRERGAIEIVEAGTRSLAQPELVTSNMAQAVAGAELIMMAAPASAHRELAASLAPHLKEGQIIFLNPGHTGGSLHLAAVLAAQGAAAKIRICESVTLTYICRLTGPSTVEVYRRTKRLRCAAFPGRFTSKLAGEMRKIYPDIVAAENVMETGLSNINAIMHPAGMLGNAGRIEQGEDFCFYSQGITPAIARLIAAVDRERLDIVKRLGLKPLSFVEIFYQAGLTSDNARASGSVYRAIHESEPNKAIRSPGSLDHRYLKEDVGYGLVPMAEIGGLAGSKTPVIDSLITLASELNRVDYRAEGLTLEKMGLSQVKPENLEEVLYEGF